jgi:hypothetical protein
VLKSASILDASIKGREGGVKEWGGTSFPPHSHGGLFSTTSIELIRIEVLEMDRRVGEATYLESRRSNRHQQLFPNSFPSKIPRPGNSPRHTHQLTCRACTLVTVDIVIVLV